MKDTSQESKQLARGGLLVADVLPLAGAHCCC